MKDAHIVLSFSDSTIVVGVEAAVEAVDLPPANISAAPPTTGRGDGGGIALAHRIRHNFDGIIAAVHKGLSSSRFLGSAVI